jgi:alanyl-tRNA synthetase
MGLTDVLKVQPDQLTDRVSKLVAQLKAAERQIADLKSRNVLADVGAIAATAHDMWGVGYIAHRADGVAGNDLRNLAFEIRNRVQDHPSVIAVVGGPPDKPAVGHRHHPGRPRPRPQGRRAGQNRQRDPRRPRRWKRMTSPRGGAVPDSTRVADALKSVEHAIGHALQS